MRSKPLKKRLFFFQVPIYDREICVIVGLTHPEAIAAAKKQKCTKSFLQTLDSEYIREQPFFEDTRVAGMAIRHQDDYFLLLRPYKYDWKYLDTLNHECFHLTQFIAQPIKFWDEVEPPAYLHSWLFTNIRKALQRI